jgi:hypothetical protein
VEGLLGAEEDRTGSGPRDMSIGKHERPNKGATDIWLTPLEIIDALGPFDLDPCGEQFHKTAKTI